RDAGIGESRDVLFDVVADLQDARLFEERLQAAHRLLAGDLLGRRGGGTGEGEPIALSRALRRAMAERDVARLARRKRQRNAEDRAARAIGRAGLGMDRHRALRARRLDPAIESCGVLDEL